MATSTFATTGPPPVSFLGPIVSAVGSEPGAVAVGDFNGDGKLDAVVVNYGGGTISVLLGNGDGTFQPQAVYTVGSNPVAVQVADFNGDGKLDLVVANEGSNTVSILLGNGDGTFQTPVNYGTGNLPSSVALGDFNGDGKLDVAVSNYGEGTVGTVSVLLGNGDGTFQTQKVSSAGTYQMWLVAGDFNGDGKLDVAVANYTSNYLSILLGNGDGTFGTAVSNPSVIGGPWGVAVGDFNHDGHLDLATCNIWSSSASVLIGNGDGTFQPHVEYPVGAEPRTITVGDFNGDHLPDLAVGYDNGGAGGGVSVLLGNGDGTFQSAVNFTSGNFTWAVAVGDFNGDGLADLVATNYYGNTVSVLLNSSKPATSTSLNSTSANPSVPGQSVTFTATVTYSGSTAPTGDVTFMDGTTTLGVIALANGSAVYTTSTLASGSHSITATYSGDSNYSGSTSAPWVQTVIALPVASLTANGLTFAGQVLGTASAVETVTLNNTGSGTLNISSIATSGDFTQANNCDGSVGAHSSCTLNVTFTPTAIGTRSGTLTITDNNNGVTGSMQTVTLTGTGVGAPAASVSPSTLTFASAFVNSTSSAQTVTLSNPGSLPLAVAAITISGNFAQTNNCPSSVAVGGSCAINITFTPVAGGSRTGTLMITDNSNNITANSQTVSLTGVGMDFAFASSSSLSATVAPGQPATYTLSVGSQGGMAQMVSLTCSGVPAAANCVIAPNPVAAGNFVGITITTTAAAVGTPRILPLLPPAFPRPQILLMLAGLLLGVAWKIRSGRLVGARRWWTVVLPLAAGLLLTLGLAACGGGSGISYTHSPGTPAGTYTVTVTGTSTSGSSTLTHTTSLTLNVT